MAGKDDEDDLVVNIDDLDTVIVNADGLPEVEPKVEPKEPKVVKTKRVDPDEPAKPTGPTPEEALAQAQAYAKEQESGRKAAEATAASERSMREQAQRQASQAQQDATDAQERAANSELTVIENGIASATKELEAHEAEYTRAAEAGEFAKMAAIQTKLSRAAAALDRLENSKANFTVATPKTTEGRVEAPQTNAFEKYVSAFAPVAQNWLRQHPDCVPPQAGGNTTKHNAMMAGHYAALQKNLQEGTPEYFKTIEDHVSPQAQEVVPQPGVTSKAAEIQTAVVEPKPVKHVQPSAPVSRDAPSASGQPQARNVREVRLTKDQQEMAKVSFPHLPEAQAYGQYARNLIELEAEGKIGRSTH